jgi:hypothetical protein
VGLVAWQVGREARLPGHPADPRGPLPAWRFDWRVWAPAPVLGLATGLLLGPLPGLVAVVMYGLVLLAGPLFARERSAPVETLLAVAVSLRLLAAVGLSVYGLATHGDAVLDDEVALNRAGIEVAAILAVGKGDLQSDWWHLPGPYLSSIGALYWLVAKDFTLVRLVNAGLGALAVGVLYGVARALFGQPSGSPRDPQVGVTPPKAVVWGASSARVAGWLVALWPVVVFWSGTGLRESAFAVASLLVPWLLLGRGDARTAAERIVLATTIGLALFVMWTYREYAVAAMLAGLLLAAAPPVVGWVRAHRQPAAAVALVLLVGLGVAAPRLAGVLRSEPVNLALGWLSPRGLEYRAAATELSTIVETDPRKRPAPPSPDIPGVTTIVRVQLPGETELRTGVVAGYEYDPFRYHIKFDKDSDVVVDPDRVQRLTDDNVGWDAPLGRLLDGLRLLIAPPAPFGPLAHVATIPDALAWDVLAALAVASAVWMGRRRIPRPPPSAALPMRPGFAWLARRSPAWLVCTLFPLVMLLALGFASAYLGTVVRHRSMLVPWLALLAAPAIVRLARAWADRRPPVAAVPLAPVPTAGAVAGSTISDER